MSDCFRQLLKASYYTFKNVDLNLRRLHGGGGMNAYKKRSLSFVKDEREVSEIVYYLYASLEDYYTLLQAMQMSSE